MLENLNKGYKVRNRITEEVIQRRNHHYGYIQNLLNNLVLDPEQTPAESFSLKSSFKIFFMIKYTKMCLILDILNSL